MVLLRVGGALVVHLLPVVGAVEGVHEVGHAAFLGAEGEVDARAVLFGLAAGRVEVVVLAELGGVAERLGGRGGDKSKYRLGASQTQI